MTLERALLYPANVGVSDGRLMVLNSSMAHTNVIAFLEKVQHRKLN